MTERVTVRWAVRYAGQRAALNGAFQTERFMEQLGAMGYEVVAKTELTRLRHMISIYRGMALDQGRISE